MSTPPRWGDVSSDDDSSDDEIHVSDLQKQATVHDDDENGFFDKPPLHQEQQHQQQQQNRGSPPGKTRGRGSGRIGGRENQQHQGGRGRDNIQHQRGRGRGAGGHHHENQQDWKSMAKSASKFTPESVPSMDGSAWMASRRAKLQQQEEEIKKKAFEDRQHEEELKRQRRKAQVEALALALEERKMHDAVTVGPTSLQAAASASKPLSHTKGPPEDDVSVTSAVSASSRSGSLQVGGHRHEVGESPKLSAKKKNVQLVVDNSHQSNNTDSIRGASGRGFGHGRGRGCDRGDSWRSTGSHSGIETTGSGSSWRAQDGGQGRSGEASRRDSWRSHDSGGGRGGRTHDGGGGRGGRTHDGGSTRGGKSHDTVVRGRGGMGGRGAGAQNTPTSAKHPKATEKGQIHVGKPQVVRTPSGDIQFHVKIGESDKPSSTQGELLPNGSVLLSKKSGTSKVKHQPQSPKKLHHKKGSKSKSPTRPHTSLKTKLEI